MASCANICGLMPLDSGSRVTMPDRKSGDLKYLVRAGLIGRLPRVSMVACKPLKYPVYFSTRMGP